MKITVSIQKHGRQRLVPRRFLKRTLISMLGVMLTLLIDRSVPADQPLTFRVGASVSDITPPLGLPIVGNWDSPPATRIHDKLQVRCVALNDGETTIVFAVCDNVGIPRRVFDQARRMIDAKSVVPSANVMMSATHTHSGVSARNDREVDGVVVLDNYQTLVARRISEAVVDAVANLQPAEIGWGSVDEPSEVHNRRWYMNDPKMLTNPFGGVDQVRMNPPAANPALMKPAGPVDPEVSFVIVRSTSGTPIALLANYSLHYVGGVPSGDVSADYFAAFSDRIGKQIGGDVSFVGIMTNGTSGDINNYRFREKRVSHPSYERIDQVSKKIADRVAEASESIEYHQWVPLGSRTQELTLSMRKPDAEMQQYFAGLRQDDVDPKSFHQYAAQYAERVEKLEKGPNETTILLQAFRIGDLGISAIPFEVFAETGLDLKKRNPFPDSFTIELSNGSEGYLPTPGQHQLGGYETWMGTNRVQLDASDRISDVLLKLLNELKP